MFIFFCKHVQKKFVCNDYCVAFHNDKSCFVSDCNFHIIPLGNVDVRPKKLDTFCFTYQHVDCLYTLFKYRFSEKTIAKTGQVFDKVQRPVEFNHRNKGLDICREHCKKEAPAEKVQNAFIQLLSEDKIR